MPRRMVGEDRRIERTTSLHLEINPEKPSSDAHCRLCICTHGCVAAVLAECQHFHCLITAVYAPMCNAPPPHFHCLIFQFACIV